VSSTPELESTEDVCPHLGLAEDADSHATYATDAHRCFRLEKPTRIAPNHQERFCLSANHTTCPIFQGEGIAATLGTPPPEAQPEPASAAATVTGARLDRPGASTRPARLGSERPRDPLPIGPRPRPGGVSMRNLTIGIFVLAAVVLGFSFWLLTRGDDDNGLPANPTGTATPTQATTQTPGATGPAGTGTPGASPTGTVTPGTRTPTTPGSGGNTYIVQEGDTCSGIAAANDVDLQDFLDANDLTEDDCLTLAVGQEVIIP
jgi:hypothetical protein